MHELPVRDFGVWRSFHMRLPQDEDGRREWPQPDRSSQDATVHGRRDHKCAFVSKASSYFRTYPHAKRHNAKRK